MTIPKERSEVAFEDFKPAYNAEQALTEASRCLFCADAPCIKACPTSIDIPQFIRKIATDNVQGAVEPAEFVDSGYPDDAPVLALESWVASSPLSPGDPPRQYEPGELVMFDGAMYRAIATNTNETPPDHPASWALVPAAPDDLRATPGSAYDGIGLP